MITIRSRFKAAKLRPLQLRARARPPSLDPRLPSALRWRTTGIARRKALRTRTDTIAIWCVQQRCGVALATLYIDKRHRRVAFRMRPPSRRARRECCMATEVYALDTI